MEDSGMCLGIPGKVVSTYDMSGVLMGKIDFGGLTKEVCLAYIPDIEVGDYAIVHVGFAITKLDEASALETLDLLRQMRTVEEELGNEVS
jgi:hydrogenase expression/formation protein HypC